MIAPDPGSWNYVLDLDLSYGSSFHFSLFGFDQDCNDPNNQEDHFDSPDVDVVPNTQLTGASTITETTVIVAFQTSRTISSTFTETRVITTLRSSQTTPLSEELAAALAIASSSAYAKGQDDEASQSILPYSAVLSLEIGLGVGAPLLIATAVALTFYLCLGRRARTQQSLGNDWGTQVDADRSAAEVVENK